MENLLQIFEVENKIFEINHNIVKCSNFFNFSQIAKTVCAIYLYAINNILYVM